MSWKMLAIAAALLHSIALPAAAVPAAENRTYSGVVLELKDVERYTYVRLQTNDGEIWAAVPKAALQVGSRITIGSAMTMNDFESRALKRRFARLVFGELSGPDGRPPPAHPSGPEAAASLPAKVARATGADARSVVEVVNGKNALKDQPVRVRGQVVKVNLGVMGKNWLHLQDGSGSSADGTHDVIVTTQDVAAVGDIVTASGIVRTDVNLGSGYRYAVLIENAKVQK